MELTDLPGQTKTKKELIRDLVLHHSQTSTDEIASKANTTKEYVWKVKSVMGSERVIAKRRTTTRISAQRKDETMFLASDSALKGRIQSRPTILKRRSGSDDEQYQLHYLNIPPVDSDGMKTIYKEFVSDKKPVEIIAEHGFPPIVVEQEYTRFLKLQGMDIQTLQSFIGNELRKYPGKGVELLEKNLQQNGYLTTDQMIETIKIMKEFLSNRTSSTTI